MAKLDLDEKKVESVIEKLTEAKDTLSNIDSGMSSGLSLIVGARGSNYLDTSTLNTGKAAAEACISDIDTMIATIQEKAQAILDYNNDVSKMGFGKRLLGTIGMFGSKLVEGVFTAGEQLVDGFASIIGWGAGLFGAKDFKAKVGEFVAKDHVGDAFHNFYYNTSFGKSMTQASYMKEDGKLANFTKGVGTAVGYAAAIYFTGGALGAATGFGSGTAAGMAAAAHGAGAFGVGAAAASSSLAIGAGAAGVGALGGTMQAGLKIGMDYDTAFKKGVINGAISAATVVAFNQLIKWGAGKIQARRAAANGGGGTGATAGPDVGPTGPGSSGGGATAGGTTGGATGGSAGYATGSRGVAGKSAEELGQQMDDLLNAAKNGTMSPEAAYKQATSLRADIASTFGKGSAEWNAVNGTFRTLGKTFHPDIIGQAAANTASTDMAAAGQAVAGVTDDVINLGTNAVNGAGATPVANAAGGLGDDVIQLGTNAVKGAGANPVANAAAGLGDDVIQLGTTAAANTAGTTGGSTALMVVEQNVDDVVNLGTQAVKGAGVNPVANAAAGLGDDVIQLGTTAAANTAGTTGGSTALMVVEQNVDDVVNMGTQAVKGAAATPAANVVGTGTTGGTSTALTVAEQNVDDVSRIAGGLDDLTNNTAYQEAVSNYQAALDRHEIVERQLAELGEIPGNAPQAQFEALRAELKAIEESYGPLGQAITDSVANTPQTTALVPVGETGLVPAQTTALVPVGETGLVPAQTTALVPVGETGLVPAQTTALVPVGETGLVPAQTTALVPVGETGLVPAQTTALVPVGETGLVPVGETGLVTTGTNLPATIPPQGITDLTVTTPPNLPATIPPQGVTDLAITTPPNLPATIPPKGPTDLVVTTPPNIPVTIPPKGPTDLVVTTPPTTIIPPGTVPPPVIPIDPVVPPVTPVVDATPVVPLPPITDPGTIPITTTPGTTAPGTIVPGTTSPGTTSPGTTSPGTTSPGTTSPGTTSPGTTAPGTTSPGTTAPGTTSPGTTAPGTTSPGTTAPGTTAPPTTTAPTQPRIDDQPVPEYAPIPDTMVSGKSLRDYAIPAAIGAAAGVTGLAVAASRRNHKAEYLSDDDDDDDDDDYDDDFFESSESERV